ncbi:MAG: Chemotaxis protein methyltransferase CheR, partial [uncultured Ramlibacter sp.]
TGLAVPAFLQGDGALRALFRSRDWSATPLGPAGQWPQELATVVDLMLNAGHPAAVIWGPKHTFLYNDAYASILGGLHPAALGQAFPQVWPDIWPQLRPAVEAAMAGRTASLENMPLTIAPGGVFEERWFTSSYSPVRDRQGRVLGLFKVRSDTSSRVLDERRLAFQLALADRLRPLSSPEAIVAAASEMLGQHLGASRLVYAEIDDPQGSFVIRHEWLQPGTGSIAGRVHRLDDFGPEAMVLLRGGEPMVVDDVTADPRTRAHADSYAGIGVRANLAVPLVKAGALVVALSVHCAQPRHWTEPDVRLVQEVAERTWLAVEAAASEATLRETQAWMSAMFDSLPVGVGVFDTTGAAKLTNHAMRRYLPTGRLPSTDAERISRWRFAAPDGGLVQPRNFPGARAARGERVVPGLEALYKGDDGQEIWTEVAAVPIRDRQGRVTGQVSVVHEIDALKRTETEQRRLAADLAESNRRQSEFLAVLAHELRNPLAPILTGLELMRLRPDNVETATRVRNIVERQTRQMVHLIDDLLDIARVTSGKIEIRRRLVDLHTAVATAVETSLPVIEKAGHQLSVQRHDGALAVSADPTRLAQIVGNLLSNAAKFTAPGGRIRLMVEKDGDQAIVSVTDNGMGIPAESLSSIFEMFSQVERDTDGARGGLGIGLALVRQLVS